MTASPTLRRDARSVQQTEGERGRREEDMGVGVGGGI